MKELYKILQGAYTGERQKIYCITFYLKVGGTKSKESKANNRRNQQHAEKYNEENENKKLVL